MKEAFPKPVPLLLSAGGNQGQQSTGGPLHDVIGVLGWRVKIKLVFALKVIWIKVAVN